MFSKQVSAELTMLSVLDCLLLDGHLMLLFNFQTGAVSLEEHFFLRI